MDPRCAGSIGVPHGDDRQRLFRGQGMGLGGPARTGSITTTSGTSTGVVTARLQTPYVREYNEETRARSAWFLLDLSASVEFGSGKLPANGALATEFVTVLARILTRHGNRVGADRLLTAIASTP